MIDVLISLPHVRTLLESYLSKEQTSSNTRNIEYSLVGNPYKRYDQKLGICKVVPVLELKFSFLPGPGLKFSSWSRCFVYIRN